MQLNVFRNARPSDSRSAVRSSVWEWAGATLVAGILAILLGGTAPAHAQFATDDASDAVYSPSWDTGDNGGSDFRPWTLNSSGSNSGHFIGSSAGNGDGDDNGDDDINTGSNNDVAFGLFANSGEVSEAIRPFDPQLFTGERIDLQFDNGFVNNGTSVGIALRNSSSQNLVELLFIGGTSDYTLNDATTGRNTGVGFTDEGLDVSITLTGPSTYQISITPLGGSTTTLSGTLASPGGGQNVAELRVFNASAGPGVPSNFFVNSFVGRSRVVNATQETIFTTIQGSIDDAATVASDVIWAGRGTFTENVTVDKSLTLNGTNVGTPGNDASRNPESVVDAGTGTFGAAFSIDADDVTIDGFRLIGDQGVFLDGSTGSGNGVGLVVQNNLVETNLAGVRVENLTTTAFAAFTVQDNQFAIQQQEYDLPPVLGGDADTEVGNAAEERTTSISMAVIDGTAVPTLLNNVITDDGDDDLGGVGDANPSGRNDGAFYGYLLRGVKVNNGPVTIDHSGLTGTSISGAMQGIAILDGSVGTESDFAITDVEMDGFAGVANLEDVNFHAGVFVFTSGLPSSAITTTGSITNVTVRNTDVPDTANDPGGEEPSAGLYFGGFSALDGNGNFSQSISVTNATIEDNANRGIHTRGDNATVTVTQSTFSGNGNSPASGNPGVSVFARQGASLTVTESEIVAGGSSDAVLRADNFENGSYQPNSLEMTVSGSLLDRNGGATFLAGTISGTAGATQLNGSSNAFQDTGTLLTTGSAIGSFVNVAGGVEGDFSPFLNSATDTDGGTAGFQGDFSSLTVTTEGDQVGSFTDNQRIAEGIDAVDASGTVAVESGTFVETLAISKSVTLNGAQSGTPGNDAARGTGETILEPATASVNLNDFIIAVQASAVTIDGFTFDSATTTPLEDNNDGAELGVIIDTRSTLYNSITVQNNIFREFPSVSDAGSEAVAGILGISDPGTPSAGNTFADNLMENFAAFESGGGVNPQESNSGIVLGNNFFATLTDNVTDNVAFGITMVGHSPTSVTGFPNPQTVSGGSHSNNHRGIVIYPGVVEAEYAIENLTVDANDEYGITLFRFDGSSTGLLGDGTNAVTATITNVTATNTGNFDPDASGINVSGSAFDFTGTTPAPTPFGQYDVTITGSTISDNENRGIHSRASDDQTISVTVNQSVLEGNGHNPNGANAAGLIAQRGGVLTVNNSFVSNSSTNNNATGSVAVAVKSEGGSGDNGRLTITESEILAEDQSGTPSGDAAVVDAPAGGSDPGFLNASGNWWGDADPATFIVSDATAGVLDITPALRSGDTDPGTDGFQGDFSALTVSSRESQNGGTGRLAEANGLLDLSGSSGTLFIDADAANLDVTDAVTLAAGTVLELTDGTLDITGGGSLTLASDASGSAFISGGGTGTVNGDVTMERYIDKTDDAAHFRHLSSPFAVLLDDAGTAGNDANLLSNVWTQSIGTGANVQVAASNASVYTYDEAAGVGAGNVTDGWTDVDNLNTTITRGTGQTVYLFQNNRSAGTNGFPVTLSVTGTATASENDGSDQSPALTYTSNDTDTEDGWNLIANPFAAPLDWDAIESEAAFANLESTVYVYDANSNGGAGGYTTYTAGNADNASRYLAPFQAFFVKATAGSPDLTLSSNEKVTTQDPALQQIPSEKRPFIALALQSDDGSRSEVTKFRFDEHGDAGKDAYDAYQLYPLSGQYSLIASHMDGSDALFDHQQLPLPGDTPIAVDVSTDINMEGAYTIGAAQLTNLPDDWQVILEDVATGARYDLRAGDEAALVHEGTDAASEAEGLSQRLHAGPVVATASETPAYRLHVGPADPLPVELASFSGTRSGSDVRLRWETLSETNNAGFEVQHQAPESTGFDTVGFVEGAGTTTEAQTYRFIVEDLPFGEHTFRLRQVDTDGTATLSDETRFKIGLSQSHVVKSVYPNPVRGQATIEFAVNEAEQVTVSLYNLLGQRVRTLYHGTPRPDTFESVDLRTDDLSSGMYLLRVEGERFSSTQRLSIVH